MNTPRASFTKATRSILALAVSSFAASGCSSEPAIALPATSEVLEPNALVCGDSVTLEDRELYVLPALRKKLDDFPDFAREAGMTDVHGCEEARAFRAAYTQYAAEHPGFDREQPLGPPPSLLPEPEGPLPTAEVSKILNGTPPDGVLGEYPRGSVVRLTKIMGQKAAGGGNCSATFIAKNWLITSAHCLAVTRPQNIPPEERLPADVTGYARWQIDWTDAAGDALSFATVTATIEDMLQQPDPRWMGGLEDPFDFALIYLPASRYDPVLPPQPFAGAAMRLALDAPSSSQTFSIAGFGQFSSTAARVLREGTIGPVTLSPDGIIQRAPSSPGEAALCTGDSGGPLYEVVDIVPATLPPEVQLAVPLPQTVPVLVGVATSIQPLDTSVNRCASTGNVENWVPISAELGFIEERLQLWQNGPLFHCRKGGPAGGGADTFEECWGKPCEIPDNCGASEYCSRPASDFRRLSCQACLGSCSCVVGQCLPKHP